MTNIPDTDLVRIAEREVIQRARLWAEARISPSSTAHTVLRCADNLAAAVALLESRESLVRVEGETK